MLHRFCSAQIPEFSSLHVGLLCTFIKNLTDEYLALTCQAIKKEKKVFAGSLILAKDTVCYLGELTKYKKDVLESIKSVLESGVIVTLSPHEEDVTQDSYPIMATIWTHCSIK